ncbi:guanine nucleotide-binding protein G(s) subunit alpha isoforms XLas-like [Thamnophis elegans]|uniref:guanine nucleotide-binding protein G(s) subunit alpha isoforms XLas-like n=1 Tax=Thamnophis elegans TaxID=35005 RepID=UPI001376D8F7|nr:guanine nucleotide-binding protein G(s) subunit alpha isoforms XLas-like [Thamnophis elegans]
MEDPPTEQLLERIWQIQEQMEVMTWRAFVNSNRNSISTLILPSEGFSPASPTSSSAPLPGSGENLQPGTPPGRWSLLHVPGPSSPSRGAEEPPSRPGSRGPASAPLSSFRAEATGDKVGRDGYKSSGGPGSTRRPEHPSFFQWLPARHPEGPLSSSIGSLSKRGHEALPATHRPSLAGETLNQRAQSFLAQDDPDEGLLRSSLSGLLGATCAPVLTPPKGLLARSHLEPPPPPADLPKQLSPDQQPTSSSPCAPGAAPSPATGAARPLGRPSLPLAGPWSKLAVSSAGRALPPEAALGQHPAAASRAAPVGRAAERPRHPRAGRSLQLSPASPSVLAAPPAALPRRASSLAS